MPLLPGISLGFMGMIAQAPGPLLIWAIDAAKCRFVVPVGSLCVLSASL